MLSEKRKERNRDGLGIELRDARNKAGYTQKGLAYALGLEYYTMVSQMELGYISIPPSLWVKIAYVLGMQSELWVLRCLVEYQPEVYNSLFWNRSVRESADFLKLFHQGKLDDKLKEESK